MKKDELRKASITRYEDGSGEFSIGVLFHGWGNQAVHLDNGTAISVTIGIVEHEDGRIECVIPRRIRFED